jgi:hypothetical protein
VMEIEIDLTQDVPRISLSQPNDFTAFKIVATGDRGRLATAIQSIGRAAGGDAFVEPAAIRQLAGDLDRDPSWSESLDGMIAYASQHSWVSDDGAVRAHVEWR